eukprot:TRINITY_DN5589_c0_g2_i8.p2 TRINITY_DN5589_c0_g2~~TRINITY_DN5589_c0_g2_i8.p2  ORF type:complete len:140 (-),score=18.99 TRINITY_DN5589_c0_g2_i8:194-613(-)
MKKLRNIDMQEITLEIDGEVKLRFGKAYGFRNLQSLVRKIKNGTSQYDFVEVMACPGGCLNGGGQIKYKEGCDAKEELRRLEELYHDKEVVFTSPQEDVCVKQVYEDMGVGLAKDILPQKFHTQYHKREKLVTSTIQDW